jgi:hypothetical protein
VITASSTSGVGASSKLSDVKTQNSKLSQPLAKVEDKKPTNNNITTSNTIIPIRYSTFILINLVKDYPGALNY